MHLNLVMEMLVVWPLTRKIMAVIIPAVPANNLYGTAFLQMAFVLKNVAFRELQP